MKLLFVGCRDNRHSKFGGYDWIRFYPNSDYLSDKDVFLGKIKFGTPGKFLNLFFLDRASKKKANEYDIVHYFYGDSTLFYPFPKNRKYKAVVTIHLDTEKKEKHHKNMLKCLKSCDAVIVLNSAQCNFLKTQYNLNAFFLPHGFNLPSFSYKRSVLQMDSNKINIVTVGKQYRDYETLENTIKYFEKDERFHFYLVGTAKDKKEVFYKYSNATVCGRLDDDEYYSLISDCDYSFLPLTFATANNALMEAQSLMVPSILPNISGVLDYACKNDNLFYSSQKEIIDIFDTLQKHEKCESLKEFAQQFEWSKIYEKLNLIYSSLESE